jgi:hypothetical protein
MRVKDALVILSVMLLALCVLAPAAGAIYMEGQPIPDDGQMHILAAESGLSGEANPDTVDDGGLQSLVPAGTLPSYVWDDTPYAGNEGLAAGFPAMIVGDTLPVMTPYEEQASIPSASLPSGDDAIGSPVLPGTSGIWDFFDTGSLQTNMPVLGSLLF